MVNPAFLSEVAAAFRDEAPFDVHTKDSVEYASCIPGHVAVDILAHIIQTSDRNLALLVGRALDAQKFLQDVTYSHRLRDNIHELYKIEQGVLSFSETDREPTPEPQETTLPNGVFTVLTECYSPTCTKDRVCYSLSCPRRLEQIHRIRYIDQDNPQFNTFDLSPERPQNDDWWSTTVPKEILESVTKSEEKRQNAIYDIIKTERNYVDEMRALHIMYSKPLRSSSIIEEKRRDSFLKSVFLNSAEILAVNTKLLQKLIHRQNESHIVDKIGDIFINIAKEFHIYVEYCGNREFSRNEIAAEKAQNAKFRDFLAKTVAKVDSKAESKMELDGYLHKPIARMASYLLLLKAILEKTPDGHSDKNLIPQATKLISEVLAKMNEASGVSQNQIKLLKLQQLVNHDGFNLQLNDPERKYIYEGRLILKRATGGDVPLILFLFDHVLLMARERTEKKLGDGEAPQQIRAKNHQFVVFKRPIPLELIVLLGEPKDYRKSTAEPSNNQDKPSPSPAKNSRAVPTSPSPQTNDSKLILTINHLGRKGGLYTFLAETESSRMIWREHITKQRNARMKQVKFEVMVLSDIRLPTPHKVNCAASFNDRLVLGTDHGLYVGLEGSLSQSLQDGWSQFTKVIELERILQVEILKDHDMLLILSDKTLLLFSLEALNVLSSESNTPKKGKKIADAINFFKLGICADRTLLCAIRSTPLTSTVKVFEPVGLGNSKRRGKLGKLFMGSSDSLKLFKVSLRLGRDELLTFCKEFYIPAEATSLHFLKTKFCVGCTKGFEIVDFESLDTQGLLDPSDVSLSFAMSKESLKPISIFRIADNNYLLCYNECGFYVDKLGRRTRGDFLFNWAGSPTAFAYIGQYILAFESTFIEVWHIDSGNLQQVLPMSNLTALNVDPDSVLGVTDDNDTTVLFRLRRSDVE
ncbi:RHO1 GDP-GTP exchange protein 2 [Dinochytrium kinnereticum]|nr:RHO1 GDP-GTP exchange protein 2 [Dinochytrium kinnereticum]